MTPKEIFETRKRSGLTQQQFAERLGLRTRGAVCQLEKGMRKPTGPIEVVLEILKKEFQKKENNNSKTC